MAQGTSKSQKRGAIPNPWYVTISVLVIAAVVVAAVTKNRWLPHLRGWAGLANPSAADAEHEHSHAGNSPHKEHDHAGHSDVHSIELTEQARKNIGLRLAKVELKPFTRSILVPGMVVERPGRSLVQVTAPLTGIVTKILPTEGEAVSAGQRLFEIQLTHEELVQSQADLLRTIEELEVIGREIERIEKLTRDGGLAEKTLLERKYEQQKQQAAFRSQQQALVLHGLSTSQVDNIVQTKRLLQSLTASAPQLTENAAASDGERYYQVQELRVAPGQHVNQGDTLAILADHATLFIEGNAFERDIAVISRASAEETQLSALLENDGSTAQIIPNLKILYMAPQIDPESRTLHFYVTLINQVEQNRKLDDGRRYISWRFRPGQRTQLQIPVEVSNDCIVLPIEAIVEEGAEAYVFTPNGDHFDRRAVHVQHKDQTNVVIANDGVLFPGESIAISGAKQLQLALKNNSGGSPDPHAGHSH